MASQPKKVKCPKKKKETKYTLAFHAEGKNPARYQNGNDKCFPHV